MVDIIVNCYQNRFTCSNMFILTEGEASTTEELRIEVICFVGAVEGGFVNIIDMMMCARIIRTSDQYSMISMFFSWIMKIA